MRIDRGGARKARLLKPLSLALLGILAAGAHAKGGDEKTLQSKWVDVRSYPVQVDTRAPEPPNTSVSTAPGLLSGSRWTVGCPADICNLLTNWASSVSGWSVGRLSTGEYVYLSATDEGSWSWRRGRDIEAVTEGRFDNWPDENESPRWIPAIEGYVTKATEPLPLLQDVFVGLWEGTDASRPRQVVALFKDHETGTIDVGHGDRQVCVVATVETPVVAISASDPLHGVAWGLTLVLRHSGGAHIGILGHSLFPRSLKCMPAPA